MPNRCLSLLLEIRIRTTVQCEPPLPLLTKDSNRISFLSALGQAAVIPYTVDNFACCKVEHMTELLDILPNTCCETKLLHHSH